MTEVVLAHWLIISMAVMMVFIGILMLVLIHHTYSLERKINTLSDVIINMCLTSDKRDSKELDPTSRLV